VHQRKLDLTPFELVFCVGVDQGTEVVVEVAHVGLGTWNLK
jgi:hypothetical protein